MRPGGRRRLAALLVVAALGGCDDEGGSGPADAGTVPDAAVGSPDAAPDAASCAPAEPPTTGPPGCDDPRRCVPECAGDTVAVIGGGCAPAGIADCAEALRDDGRCRPAAARCPGGRVDLEAGCAPVGVPGCAERHLVDGVCRPRVDACPPGEIPLPVEGCVPLADEALCGDARWAEVPPGDPVVHVDPAAPGPGDGTREVSARRTPSG